MNTTSEKTTKKEMITQTGIIERGWTKSMITKWLPDPILKNNPYNRSSSIKLWDLEMVKRIEQQPSFINAMKVAEKRKVSAKKAKDTQYNNFLTVVKKTADNIKVEILDDKTLRRMAINHVQERYMERLNGSYVNVDSLDEDTISRWVVNFIRHYLVSCNDYKSHDNVFYDLVLYDFRGKVGKADLYYYYKSCVLDKIAAAYPKYADECREQKEKMELSMLYME